MAKNKNGKLSGTIGNLIHYENNGEQCIRIKGAEYNDANTEVQQSHRGKIRQSGQFLKECKRIIKIGFQASDKNNYFNEANSYMYYNCFRREDSKDYLDFSKVKISRGNIPAPEDCSIVLSGNKLEIKWRPYNKYERAFKSDHAVVMLYDSEGKSHNFTEAALRSDSSAQIEIPKNAIYPLHVWMFFHNPGFNVGESKDKISDSVYLGIIRN